MALSLRGKFYLLVASLVIGVAGILSYYFVRQLRQTVHEDLEQRARALTENLARNTEIGVLLRSTEMLEGPLRSLLADKMVLLAGVVDTDGVPLAQLGRPGQPPMRTLSATGNEVQINTDVSQGVFEVTAPVISGEGEAVEDWIDAPAGTQAGRRRVGSVYLRGSSAEAERAAHRLSYAAIAITAVLVGAYLLVGIVVVQHIVNPLVSLEAGTRHIAQGNLSFRVPMVGR
ncbi:MAG: hypothetical protein ACRDHY_18040, partial [Anaerolineales bacterium]